MSWYVNPKDDIFAESTSTTISSSASPYIAVFSVPGTDLNFF